MPDFSPYQNQTLSLCLLFSYYFCTSAYFTSRTFISANITIILILFLDTTEVYVMYGGVSTVWPSAKNIYFRVKPASNLTSNIMCAVSYLYRRGGPSPSSLASNDMVLLVTSLSIEYCHRVLPLSLSIWTYSSTGFGTCILYLWVCFQ